MNPRKQCVSKFKNKDSAAGFPSQLHNSHGRTSARPLSLGKTGDTENTHLIRAVMRLIRVNRNTLLRQFLAHSKC